MTRDSQAGGGAIGATAVLRERRRRRLRLWLLVTAAASVLFVGGWYLLLWLRAPAIRAGLPRWPDLASSVPAAMAEQIREADRRARSGLPAAGRIGHLGQVCQANLYEAEAAACYRLAGRLAPGDYRWPYLLAVVGCETGTGPEVIAGLERTVRLKPDFACAWLRLGDVRLKAGQFEPAAAAYRSATGAPAPWRQHALLGLARVAEHRRDWPGIVALLAPAVEHEPAFLPGRRALARAYAELGRAAEAERITPRRSALALSMPFPDPLLRQVEDLSCSVSFLLKQATIANRQDDLRRAGQLLLRLVQVAPQDADAHIALAGWCRDQAIEAGGRGETTAAQELLRAGVREAELAARLDPSSGRAHFNWALALEVLGDLPAAVDQFRQTIALEPLMVEAQRRLGLALSAAANHEEAIRACRQAVAMEPQSTEALDSLGVVLAQADKWQEAAEWWSRSIEIDPTSPVPRFNRARAWLSLNRQAEAVAELRQLVASHPDMAVARALLEEVSAAPGAPR